MLSSVRLAALNLWLLVRGEAEHRLDEVLIDGYDSAGGCRPVELSVLVFDEAVVGGFLLSADLLVDQVLLIFHAALEHLVEVVVVDFRAVFGFDCHFLGTDETQSGFQDPRDLHELLLVLAGELHVGVVRVVD
jgi:hypothetical protein